MRNITSSARLAWSGLVSQHKDIVVSPLGCGPWGHREVNDQPPSHFAQYLWLCLSPWLPLNFNKYLFFSRFPSLLISYRAPNLNDVKGDYKCFYWNWSNRFMLEFILVISVIYYLFHIYFKSSHHSFKEYYLLSSLKSKFVTLLSIIVIDKTRSF